jgi:hypothetical protein
MEFDPLTLYYGLVSLADEFHLTGMDGFCPVGPLDHGEAGHRPNSRQV